MMMRVSKIHVLSAFVAMAGLFVSTTSGDVHTFIDNDGTNVFSIPTLVLTHGTFLENVPLAKLFGLDINNNLDPLPDPDRFPNDMFDTLAKDEFLAASAIEQNAVGAVAFFGDFNEPNPGAGQTLVRVTLTLPLRMGPGGPPLGGPGQRWIKFQCGNNGNGGNPNPNPKQKEGRKGAYLKPQRVPSGMTYWAAFIKGIQGNPGETEQELSDRVKAAIIAAKKRARRKSLEKYDKLVDNSKYMDPPENSVIAIIDTDPPAESVDVEMVLLVDEVAFDRLGEFLAHMQAVITNDPAIASTDPDNQPEGEILLATGTVDLGAGEMISLGVGDPDVDEVDSVPAVTDEGIPLGVLDVTFFAEGELGPTDGATQYLDIATVPSADPPGVFHMIAYDVAVDDTPEDIAQDLAESVNGTPHDGEFKYLADVLPPGNIVRIERADGLPISAALLRKTNTSAMLFEQLSVNGPIGEVPTVSEWGLIVLALLLLTAGTIVFGRRRRPAVA